MAPIIFRKEALNRLKSPEELDEAIVLISPRGWLALAGCSLFVVVGIVWAFWVAIPVKVDTYGILYYSGKVDDISALQDGILEAVFVKEGQAVQKGQLLARMKITEVDNSAKLSDEQKKALEEMRAPYDGVVMEISNYSITTLSKGAPILLLSPLGDNKKDLMGTAFVSVLDTKKIKQGMKVEIEIASVKHEQSGYLLGTIEQVASVPSSKTAIRSIFKNENLSLFIENRIPIAPQHVLIRLARKPGRLTGYRWTGKEPEGSITPGTVFKGHITIDQNHPIDYLTPIYKRFL